MPKLYSNRLVNAHNMVHDAFENHYAIGHFNINNLEWTKAVLETAQKTNTPIIVATSEGAIKYMGGIQVVVAMVDALMETLNITVPVALHLDHGQSVEMAKACIDAGYSSVMFDGSHLPFEENIEKTKEVVAYAKPHEVSVEAEIGSIGGEEDGVIGEGELGDPAQAKTMVATGIDFLAAGIGNIHGPYPSWWKSLNFDQLAKIEDAVHFPLVMHGGSGVPQDQVEKAISMGVAKVNINTELQLAFEKATREYVMAGKSQDMKAKGFDPRKLLKPGYDAICAEMTNLITWMGSKGKADQIQK
ncbi:class II fructose-1,6-bisphosphate aldolase [Mesoplasma lactucae]|uniref:Fructose-1,6-bisphosphate aldolase, class II n=1 Tax=Mesoplasma lactucae ATCC 49193 TaxID=81460 RepID=A0A291ISS8_9MOLU|nr:class II fructose-1,6-bisphosphate aldolase [Mesoplasma lactucae]ATG97756.1 fructose-1,6-bisphosphate aldolase, class II [Mesoplasma lactucae ATCC 49193]ATZ20467.1 fructose-bisphosphate aldolase [Mesoplasma lactucae ATCC 49193]MCL8216639.1 Fructose-bisphosphate aldolase [Mesoplasma lactucae ATCC 49193]